MSPCSTHCLPIVFHCHCMQSRDVECAHLTQHFHMWFPLDISHTGASTVDSGRDPVLSQKVHGESVSSVTCEECAVKCCAFSADRPDHLILFRKYVSRKAATKGRAVLEGVGLLTETMGACFSGHPWMRRRQYKLVSPDGAVGKAASLPPGRCSFQLWSMPRLLNSTLRI